MNIEQPKQFTCIVCGAKVPSPEILLCDKCVNERQAGEDGCQNDHQHSYGPEFHY